MMYPNNFVQVLIVNQGVSG